MAKVAAKRWACSQCGTLHTKWQGKCTGCGEWNTLVEELAPTKNLTRHEGRTGGSAHPLLLSEIDTQDHPRLLLPDSELNRVLDGGLVPGSLVLVGGEPGIGKSTLLLQLVQKLTDIPILYVTGEESPQQVKRRAERLAGNNEALYLLAETELDRILEQAQQLHPQLLVVDSIQTLFLTSLDSAPGSVAQVRECTARLMRYAKESSTSVLLVGHVTKEGSIAGPKVLEHMVDVVLSFEGELTSGYRILRSSKNRFGATPELGVYAMHADGLREVPNPSALFLADREEALSGIATGVTLQANRALLIETQALVTDATYGTAQRVPAGIDLRRLHLLLAVLEKRGGFKLAQKDVFVNLAGGLRLDDPALDLALAMAIVSSSYDLPLPARTVLSAEISLTGEVRPVSRLEARAMESAKLGFHELITGGKPEETLHNLGELTVKYFATITDVCKHLFG